MENIKKNDMELTLKGIKSTLFKFKIYDCEINIIEDLDFYTFEIELCGGLRIPRFLSLGEEFSQALGGRFLHFLYPLGGKNTAIGIRVSRKSDEQIIDLFSDASSVSHNVLIDQSEDLKRYKTKLNVAEGLFSRILSLPIFPLAYDHDLENEISIFISSNFD